jgi:hypothetical protein
VKQDLEPLYAFKNFPVFMGCTDQPTSEDILEDMDWYISLGTGCIQLNPLLPQDVIYQDSHGAGLVGRIWQEHHQAFAEFISFYDPQSVLEIGGSHGILSVDYKRHRNIAWTIVEPLPAPVPECTAKFIKGYFVPHVLDSQNFDVLVHSHVLEHVYSPDDFIHQLAVAAGVGQKLMLFSVPNMLEMLKRKYTNCLNFEHTVLLTEEAVEYLLAKNGFAILAKEYFKEDHSIFYAAKKSTGFIADLSPPVAYEDHKLIFDDFIHFYTGMCGTINAEIDRLAGKGLPVYLFGAHIFSSYLFAFGLKTDHINLILDNDPQKRGRRLYGTDLEVESPHVLRYHREAVVILKAGIYNEEIKKDILENINSQVIFL